MQREMSQPDSPFQSEVDYSEQCNGCSLDGQGCAIHDPEDRKLRCDYRCGHPFDYDALEKAG